METINDELKNISQAEHSRDRAPHNFIMNLIAAPGGRTVFSTKNRTFTSGWKNLPQDRWNVSADFSFSSHVFFFRR
jgi:hypothetical protein